MKKSSYPSSLAKGRRPRQHKAKAQLGCECKISKRFKQNTVENLSAQQRGKEKLISQQIKITTKTGRDVQTMSSPPHIHALYLAVILADINQHSSLESKLQKERAGSSRLSYFFHIVESSERIEEGKWTKKGKRQPNITKRVGSEHVSERSCS